MTTSIPSKAVDGILKVVRFPADRLLHLAPETGVTTSVGLAIDHADAAIRGAAGAVLRDPDFSQDAEQRREAADERQRALRLRTKAEERVDSAETRVEKKQAEAEARRKEADEKAEQKRQKAKEQAE